MNRLCLSGLCAAFVSVAFVGQGLGQSPKEIVPLWPEGAPGASGDEPHDVPGVWCYPVTDNPKPTAVVICPGGGYRVHAVDHEGHQIARWFNRHGISAFVLRYRLAPHYKHPSPLMDAQRAIRYVRSRAADLGVSANRVGIMGFSAGGHLASTAATHFDTEVGDTDDPIDAESSRPDFVVLGYPVISLTADYAHRGSGRNLLGADADPELARRLSNETQVTRRTPPVFLFHTYEDKAVPPDNSIAFFRACRRAGVPAELHVYRDGPHGVGWANGHPAVGKWQQTLKDWLRSSGLLVTTKRVGVRGTVARGGKPLGWGTIAFVPDDPDAPTAWAPVRGGKFEIPDHRGACVGNNRIELYDLGAVQPGPTIDDVRQLVAKRPRVQVSTSSNSFTIEVSDDQK